MVRRRVHLTGLDGNLVFGQLFSIPLGGFLVGILTPLFVLFVYSLFYYYMQP